MSDYITGLMTRARRAQAEIEFLSQEKVDEICESITWASIQEPFATELCKLAIEETRMGDFKSKYAKMMNKTRGGWFDMKGKKIGRCHRRKRRAGADQDRQARWCHRSHGSLYQLRSHPGS